MFRILQSAVNHWVGTVRMSSRRYFGQEVARPVGGQSLGFRGEFCAGDRPWSRPKCRRFGGVGLSQSGSIGALRRQPKYNLTPFLFPVQGKILERQNRALSFPRIARGSRFLPTPGAQESEDLNFLKKDLLARKSCLFSSAAASFQQIGRTPPLSSHERLSAPASSE